MDKDEKIEFRCDSAFVDMIKEIAKSREEPVSKSIRYCVEYYFTNAMKDELEKKLLGIQEYYKNKIQEDTDKTLHAIGRYNASVGKGVSK